MLTSGICMFQEGTDCQEEIRATVTGGRLRRAEEVESGLRYHQEEGQELDGRVLELAGTG